MSNIDLNKVREAVLAARNNGQKITPHLAVNDQGQIVITSPRQRPQELSRLPSQRFSSDIDTIAKMPPGTCRWTSPDGTGGVLWEMVTDLQDEFTFFSYRSAEGWQTLVLKPEVEQHFRSQHTGHLFLDGRICFGEILLTLEETYGKSTLWANGMSVALRTGEFPW